MTDTDKRLREFYEHLSPDAALSESLSSLSGALVGDTPNTLGARLGSYWRQSRAAQVAGVVLAGLLTFAVGAGFHERGSRIERTERTVQEIAMNHMTRLDVEHSGQSVARLDSSMSQLPFSLTIPEHVREGYSVVGARYCSLAGHLAAHIKLKHDVSGDAISLFVTPLEEDLEAMQGKRAVVSGVDVELWQEKGLFFAMASR